MLSRLSRVGLIAGGAIAPFPAAAQEARPLLAPPAFQLDQWTTRDGLPQNSVTAIAQAPEGHLWIGTFGGLARFDGASFRLVERTDSLGRHVDRILSLAVGPDSALWIGTEGNGLLRYHRGAYDRFTAAQGVPDRTVRALYVDRGGALWVGGENGEIARLADHRFERVARTVREPPGLVVSFVQDAGGTLWVNTSDRFLTVEGGVATDRRWRDPPVAGARRFTHEGRTGARWFGLARGLARVSADGVRTWRAEAGVPNNPSVVAEDPDGGFWLGTDNDGIFFFEPDSAGGRVRRYSLSGGRRDFRVRASLLDVEGNVWFGTNANGLLRAKRNVFTTYTTAHGLSHDVATAVYGDASGVVWAATNCWGVNALDLAGRTVRLLKPRQPGDPTGDPCVFALTESPAGTLWVGTYGGGLTRIRGRREERLRSAGLADSVVLALFTDRDGAVWVGTNSGGLAVLENGRVRASYTTEQGLAHNSVRTIVQTRDGALWVGTLEGLSRFAGGRFTTYTAAQGLSAMHVRAIYEDGTGTLWIGTYGGGLNRLKDGAFTAIRTADGLADDIVSAILADDRGYLWMSGNRGVSRVPLAELQEFADGRRRRVHSVLFGETDGLLNAETNGGFQPAAWKDQRGRLWFPTVRGVAMVDPARVRVASRPPPVTVEEIVVDGEARAATDRIVVGPGRPNLEFRYTGLSLSDPEHLIFRYRLEGFDEDWVEAGARRVAYYPRLPPGRYRFAVSAANRDGEWSQAATTVGLRVTAPLRAAWWFRTGAALALVAVVLVIQRRREAAIRRSRAAQEEFSRRLIESQEHERRRIAGELHDGLGQELLVVKNRALLALQADGLHPPVREQLKRITDIATQSLESVRSLAHNLTPRQLQHLGLTAALRSMIAVTAESAGIALQVAVDDVDGLLPGDRQIDLYRVVQEGLSNVVHHAAATTATVRIGRAGDELRISILDDGRGFQVRRDERGRLKGGFGLSGIAERVRILGGRIDVVSAPGQGTRLEVAVPVSRGAEMRRA